MMKFYYRVTIGNSYLKVTSLPKAKKLVQGQKEWQIAKFETVKRDCIAIIGPEWVKIAKDLAGINVHGETTKTFLKFTIAFKKSPIAK
jgi:hypothetical protein